VIFPENVNNMVCASVAVGRQGHASSPRALIQATTSNPATWQLCRARLRLDEELSLGRTMAMSLYFDNTCTRMWINLVRFFFSPHLPLLNKQNPTKSLTLESPEDEVATVVAKIPKKFQLVPKLMPVQTVKTPTKQRRSRARTQFYERAQFQLRSLVDGGLSF
jgi:hypothetical protein